MYNFLPSEYNSFFIILKRQIRKSYVNFSYNINMFTFFLISITLFRIASNSQPIPINISFAFIFCNLIFSILLTYKIILEDDYQKGFLEQFFILGTLPELCILAKYIAMMLIYLIQIILLIPISMILLQLDWHLLPNLLLSSITTVSIVSLLVMFSSSLTLGNTSSIINAIIVMPLTIPIIIFGILSFNNTVYLTILFALWIAALPIIIFATKHAISFAIKDS